MDVPVSELNASQVLSPTVWPTGSKVRLLQVPWDSAYRDVVAWESKEERDAWFAAKAGSWYATNFQNLRPGEPVSVPVPYSSVYKYNYLTWTIRSNRLRTRGLSVRISISSRMSNTCLRRQQGSRCNLTL